MLAHMNPQVEIVVPVYNEELALGRSIRRLHDFLCASFPFTWRIVIADNASTDGTPAIARSLGRELRGVSHLRLDEKGRGRAARCAPHGGRAGRTSSPTWTSTSAPTCAR
jgi:glycosyltransferase involved in cell wall biosynthesis